MIADKERNQIINFSNNSKSIKDMMGGTLEEKKETPLDEKLEEEEK